MKRAVATWAWLGLVTTTFSFVVGFNLFLHPLAAFPAPGDLPEQRGGLSVRVTPGAARSEQVVDVEVTGNHAIAYSLDERVGERWVKRFEGGGFGCGLSKAQRAERARLWQLGCAIGGDDPLPDTRVRLPQMPEGTYRLRTTFYPDRLGRNQFELAAVFTVE